MADRPPWTRPYADLHRCYPEEGAPAEAIGVRQPLGSEIESIALSRGAYADRGLSSSG